jgi:hypothetical protein
VRGLLDEEVQRSARPARRVRYAFEVAESLGDQQPGPHAVHAARRHLADLALRVHRLLADDEAPEELVDFGLAVAVASTALRAVEHRAVARRDAGIAGARVARCAAEALRAHASIAALPTGSPVPDVTGGLLWLICDLSAGLRAAGREGRLARRWDAGVVARDAADLVVTTYRRWRPRLRGDAAVQVALAALTAAHTAAWCGLASIELDDEDDGCGRPVHPVAAPPERWAAAAAEPPAPCPDPVHAVATH